MSPFSLQRFQSPFGARASLLLAGLSLVLSGCGHSGRPPLPPQGVNVAKVVERTTSEWRSFSGQLEAIESAEIRSRVSGYISHVAFAEGGDVKQGAALFTIDDREYRAAVENALANDDRAEARVVLATRELTRTETLQKTGAAADSELDQRQVEARQAQADKNAAAAQVKLAKLNLEFSHIVAPFDGRVGKAEFRVGTLVAPNTTVLTTLVRLNPMYVSFTADEQTFLAFKSRGRKVKVRVALANESGFPHEGELTFVDNQLDRATGTIRLRAQISNSDGELLPGLYARVEVETAPPAPHLLISARAIQTDQDRQYVYVVGTDNKAIRKDIVSRGRIDGLQNVVSGLSASDRIVVDGTRKIFASGQLVNPRLVEMADPEGTAAIGVK
jgi:multidrug efflux system membrane fusion protein